jgi:hypothetical protein
MRLPSDKTVRSIAFETLPNNLGLVADNVSRRPQLESMMVGPEGCSIASRPLFYCEPQQIGAKPVLNDERALLHPYSLHRCVAPFTISP